MSHCVLFAVAIVSTTYFMKMQLALKLAGKVEQYVRSIDRKFCCPPAQNEDLSLAARECDQYFCHEGMQIIWCLDEPMLFNYITYQLQYDAEIVTTDVLT